jgi:hypothetical protein
MSRRKHKKSIPHREESIPKQDQKSSPKIAQKFFLIGFGAWKVFGIVVLAVSFLATILNLSPKISLSQSPALNSSDLFSTPFTIFNDGYFPLWNVKYLTTLNRVNSERYITIRGIAIGDPNKVIIPYLSSGDAATLIVPFRNIILKFGAITSADIEIAIIYQPFPIFWHKKKSFRFTSIKAQDGRLIFFRMPITSN